MARKITALAGLLAEPSAPAPTAKAQPSPEAQPPRPAGRPAPAADEAEPTVRSTLDLPASRNAALHREAVDTGIEVGWPVRSQHVLRAMFDEFIDDPDAVARVRQRIREQGRPTRRRST